MDQWTELGAVVFLHRVGSTTEVRLGSGITLGTGSEFALSDDGKLLAVLFNRELSIISPDRSTHRAVASKVTWFQWRPMTNDLLYETYTGKRMEWRLYSSDRSEVVLEAGSRFRPMMSPSGTWLVWTTISPNGRELKAVNLNDLSTVTMLGGKQGFPEIEWVGADSVAFLEDWQRIILLSISSGERHVFLESTTKLHGPMQWTEDGSMVAVSGEDDRLSIWARDGIKGSCSGEWRPVGWSPSNRYLVVEQGISGSLYVIDTGELERCAPLEIPGKWARSLTWHPSKDVALVTFADETGQEQRVEVWDVTSGHPESLGVVGSGMDPVWLLPRGEESQ